MVDLRAIAKSRIQECLSRGGNFEKLLYLHIMAYEGSFNDTLFQVATLKNLKNTELVESDFLHWLATAKRVPQPFTSNDYCLKDVFKFNFFDESRNFHFDFDHVFKQNEVFYFENFSKPLLGFKEDVEENEKLTFQTKAKPFLFTSPKPCKIGEKDLAQGFPAHAYPGVGNRQNNRLVIRIVPGPYG